MNPPSDQVGNVPFGKIPAEKVRNGELANLARAEWGTYIAIAGHVNGASWEACVSVPTLARCSGLHERTVQRAVKGLRQKEVLETIVGGGRGRATRYILVTNPGTQKAPFQTENPGPGVTVSQEKPRQNEPETPAESALNPGNSEHKPRHPDAARKEEQQSNSINRGADAAVEAKEQGPTSEVVEYLGTRGIEPAGARVLARQFPAATAELFAEALKGVSPTAPGGVRVVHIRDRMPVIAKRERDRRAREVQLEAELDHILTRLTTEYESDRATIDATAEGLSKFQRAELAEQAAARLVGLLGGSGEAWGVVRAWKEGLTDPTASGPFRVLMHQSKAAVEQERERARDRADAARQVRERAQAEAEEREHRERERGEAEGRWLAGLSEVELCELFDQLVATSLNPVFKAHWADAAPPPPADIRRRFGRALIQAFGPYAEPTPQPALQLVAATRPPGPQGPTTAHSYTEMAK